MTTCNGLSAACMELGHIFTECLLYIDALRELTEWGTAAESQAGNCRPYKRSCPWCPACFYQRPDACKNAFHDAKKCFGEQGCSV